MKTLLADSQPKLTAVDFDPFADGELVLIAPATEAQKEIWLSVQMGDDANCAYNESMSLRFRGLLDVKALRSSLQDLVERHKALRITFSPDGETLCIASSLKIDVPLIDLSSLSDREREAQLADIRRQEVEQPFNLTHGPLFRTQIVKLQEKEHIALLSAHHIVCDGWSWGSLLPDLGVLYSASRQGVTAELPEPERFSEYALLQSQQTQTEFIATEEYWLRQFSGQIPVLDLPTDKPRPPLRSFKSAREDWFVNPSLVADLKRIGSKAGCSFLTILLAGFEAFLHRLSGQEELVVGLPVAGQSVLGKNSLVGHCVNLLPLRSHINQDSSFSDYLQSRRSAILDAYDHQQLTFGSLLKKLAIPRDPSRIPLVSVTFNVDQAIKGATLQFYGMDVEVFSNPRSFENFEMFVNASESDGRLVLECQYNTDLFEAETIRRRLEEFEVLLAGIVADPNQQVWQLPILPKAEQQLLVDWNATQVNYPELGIHELVEQQVMRSPDAIAVVFEEQLTYRELNARANKVAHYLQTLGVAPEVLVGICVERSLWMVVGLLGILKAGGAYVPLDPAYPQERLEFMLSDSQVPVLLTQQKFKARLPETKIVCLDTDWEAIARESEINPTSSLTSDNLAYVIYTSGSTGKPKGVQIPHRAVVNFLHSMREQPGLTNQDIFLAVTSLSFDIAAMELFLPLIVGAKLVVVSREVATDGTQLLKLLDGATALQATPATWRLLLEAGWQSSELKALCGGESLSRDLANQILERSATLWNLYGPTETTIWSTTYNVDADGSIKIGRPIANTQIYLLDSHLQPVPIGVKSEMYIGGAGLARGYLNRPELTDEKFIPNPFSKEPRSRLYKTGDLARYLPDGNIECLGRLDNQVKIRGFRIELGEIEAVLNQHPDVQQSVVIAWEETTGDKRLVAYLVKTTPSEPELAAHLRSFLKEKLPDYMVPSAFVILDALPLTPNGKVDRRALPAPDKERLKLERLVAPQDLLELQLTKMWEQVLRIQPIGVQDNFFELGGHSLLAARLLAEINKTFHKNLPLATIFQAQTVEQLVNILRCSGWSPPCPSMVVIQPGSSQPPLFGIHVLGRGLEFYRPLVAYLERSQPVYGLSTQIMDEKQAPPNRVEDLAAFYIKEMRTFQPNGPYFLVGVSFGGTVAFEIARQLHAQGQKVALLGLIDSYGPAAIKHLPKRERVSRLIDLLRYRHVDVLLEKVKANWNGKVERLNFSLYRIYSKFYLSIGRPLPDYLQDFVYEEANENALKNYVPQVYPGRVTLFKGIDAASKVDSKLGWGGLAAEGIEIHNIPSSHLGMLKEPYVRVLGEQLKACLEQAQANNL